MAAQHALPRSRTFRSRTFRLRTFRLRTFRLRTFRLRPALLTLASILALAGTRDAAAQPEQLGLWSSLVNERPHIQIHMALVRGDGSPYHSRILTWEGDEADGRDGEEIGWEPGGDGCLANAWEKFTFGLWPWNATHNPGARIFCNGHTHLADGRLLSAGGDDDVNEHGIRDARTYQAGSGDQAGNWTQPASDANRMHHERFYPTLTALSDGRAIAVGGGRAPQLWVFGGLRHPASYGTGKELHRLGRALDGGWDQLITPAPDPVNGDPGLRVGHTAVRLTEGVSAQVLFGGKNGSGGNTDDDQVWELTRDLSIPPTANDFTYRWTRRSTATSALRPNGRSDHAAVALDPTAGNYTEMVIYGGLRQPTVGNPTVLPEFWRLYSDEGNWKWAEVNALGTGPGALYGHAAVYHRASRRMFVFGGSADPAVGPTNNDVWYFTFDNGTFASGTWGKLTVTGTRPTARRDHTMVIDPDPDIDTTTEPDTPYDLALWVFGGDATSTLWKLQVQVNENTGTWSPKNLSTPPAPRSGHAAYFDNTPSAQRLYIFGGEQTGLDEHVYTHKVGTGGWTTAGKAGVRLSDFTMDVDGTTPESVPYARLPEIYTPGAGGSPGTWVLQNSSGLASSPDDYSVQFLLPRTPSAPNMDRVIRVGPEPKSYYLDIHANEISGQWQEVPGSSIGASTGVMYEPGKILITNGLTGKTQVFDASNTLGWQNQDDLQKRIDHTLVMLPTGQVLATGGLDNVGVPQDRPKIWTPGKPPGQQWTAGLASEGLRRDYHNTALLLPDGRILTGGGFGTTDRDDLRLFCPPYLFKAHGLLATRPVIESAPTVVTWGQTFAICTSSSTNPLDVEKVCLMRPGSVTHSFDQNARYVPLTIQSRGTDPSHVLVTGPASPDIAPPGDYMLFILGSSDSDVMPSIASWVRVQEPNAIGADVDDVTPGATIGDLTPEIFASTEIWFTWTATADDGVQLCSGNALQFDLRYNFGPITETSWDFSGLAQGEPVPDPVGAPHQSGVTGLQPCTNYHFALRSRDDNGNLSGFHGVVTAQTVCGGGGGSGESFGAQPVSASTAGGCHDGSDAAIAGATESETATGTLISEAQRLADGSWRVTLRPMTEAELDAAGSAITVDREKAGGAREALGQFTPKPREDVLGLGALREKGRVTIPAHYRLDQVMPRFRHRGEDLELAGAVHSRLGSLGADFIANGGGVELLAGDVVDLTYAPAAKPLADAASWYLLVRRQETGAVASSSQPKPARDVPARFALYPSVPNPTAGLTRIRFDLPQESPVKLEVFDMLGRRVAIMADGVYPAGSHAIAWDLRDIHGAQVRPGVYLSRRSAGTYRARGKLTVLP